MLGLTVSMTTLPADYDASDELVFATSPIVSMPFEGEPVVPCGSSVSSPSSLSLYIPHVSECCSQLGYFVVR